MSIVERVKGICLKPAAEWGVIEQETTPTADLFKKYAIPLAAVGPIAAFIGNSFIGRSVPFLGTFRMSVGMGLTIAIASFVMVLLLVYLLSLVINALAPSFGAQKDPAQALKVAVYSFTPAWVAGIVQILPSLGILALLAGLYGLYLFYLGLQRLMKCPKEKAVGYTAAVAGIAIAMMIVLSLVVGAVAGAGSMAAGSFGGRAGGDVQFDKNSPLGKLASLGQALEEGNKKMEAAERRGDPNAQAAAAMEQLGTLMGGGKRVNPVAIDQLKPLIPETFAGLAKLSSNAERAGVAALMVSKASARYGDKAKKSVALEIADSGGASGLLGMAAWVNVQGEHEDDNGFERTQKVDGRLVHEKGSKRGDNDELTVIVADRFVVSAKGRGVALAELRTAMAALDLGKLESLKNVGVQN
jgi:hypothetical protein